MVNLRRMRFLINRMPLARYRVDLAMARATRVTPVLTGMPHVSGVSSMVENGVIELEECRKAYQEICKELTEMKSKLSPVIDSMENPLEKNVMRLRYIEGKRVAEIGWNLNYSERHIRRVLEKAERYIIEKMSAMSETNVLK